MTAWLLTSTFYGNWLPGDPRGSVTNVRDRRAGDPETPRRIEHSQVGEEYEAEISGLQRAAAEKMKGPPVLVDLPQAEQLLDQFLETAAYRGWNLLALSIMANHFHAVVEAPPAAGKTDLLRDFKSYGARRLNRISGKPASGTWWTDGGSCKPIQHLPSAVFYTCHRQPRPLLVWSRERGRIPVDESHPDNSFTTWTGEPPA